MLVDFLKKLIEPAAVNVINDNLAAAEIDALAAPSDLQIIDLEQYRETRRRLKGSMVTDSLDAFSAYCGTFGHDSITNVFVNPERMSAVAVLNFGTESKPGHADNTCSLSLVKTPEFAGIKFGRVKQRDFAEWCEDYHSFITFLAPDQANEIDPAKAVKAIRNLKAENVTKVTSGVDNFSSERSLLEQNKVDTSEGMPGFIRFTCIPYTGLKERDFIIRVGAASDSSGLCYVLNIIRLDLITVEMAEELASLVDDRLDAVGVYIGTYKAG